MLFTLNELYSLALPEHCLYLYLPMQEEMELNQIWRACRKIQGAIYRYNFDICADLKQHDPDCTGYVSGKRQPLATFQCTCRVFMSILRPRQSLYSHRCWASTGRWWACRSLSWRMSPTTFKFAMDALPIASSARRSAQKVGAYGYCISIQWLTLSPCRSKQDGRQGTGHGTGVEWSLASKCHRTAGRASQAMLDIV